MPLVTQSPQVPTAPTVPTAEAGWRRPRNGPSLSEVYASIKVPAADGGSVPSLTGLWAVANWFERECWDLFGVKFDGHPDLRRIMMYEGFVGHPLRKDYPINKRQPLIGPGAIAK